MRNRVQVSGIEETRTRLPEILGAAHHEGAVTIVTKRGEPRAAVVPVSRALRGEDSVDLVERLIREHRIAVIPGTAFGMDDGCYLHIGYGAADATAME